MSAILVLCDHADGTFKPSQTNFTSLATPGAVGSGNTALTTLMHEGGHAVRRTSRPATPDPER